jgi:hypothetical protein
MNRRQLLTGVVGAAVALPLAAEALKKSKVLIHEGNVPNFEGVVYPRGAMGYPEVGRNEFVVDAVTIRAQPGVYHSALVEATGVARAVRNVRVRFETVLSKAVPEFRVGQRIQIDIARLLNKDYSSMPPMQSLDVEFTDGSVIKRRA